MTCFLVLLDLGIRWIPAVYQSWATRTTRLAVQAYAKAEKEVGECDEQFPFIRLEKKNPDFLNSSVVVESEGRRYLLDDLGLAERKLFSSHKEGDIFRLPFWQIVGRTQRPVTLDYDVWTTPLLTTEQVSGILPDEVGREGDIFQVALLKPDHPLGPGDSSQCTDYIQYVQCHIRVQKLGLALAGPTQKKER